MKVTVEHNGEAIWYRDSENGVGMASRGYLADGTQQKIVTALVDALTQANGEMLPSQPLGEVCLTFSDEQMKEIAEDLRLSRSSMPQLYSSQDITIDSPKIKIATQSLPSEKITRTSINCLEVMQLEVESSLKYIKSEQCNNPDELATFVLQSLMDYCQGKLAFDLGNKENHPVYQWGKWQHHP